MCFEFNHCFLQTQAEERAEKYKKEKEERDGIIRNITKERHNLSG